MSLFAPIEAHLTDFATAYEAVLTRDHNGQSLRLAGPNRASFEERQIDWQREGLNLALLI